jgi:hypothetical protein
MKPDMKLNRKTTLGAICVVLTLVSTQVCALTLGRVRGGAILGQALDVSMVVQFAADEDVAAVCFTANVSYGESPLESSRITVNTQAGQQPNTQLVHITSRATVDEAVVTVNLVADCAARASRRYVLLADVVSESGGPLLNALAQVVKPPVYTSASAFAVPANLTSASVAPILAAKKRPKPTVVAKKLANDPFLKAVKASTGAGESERDSSAQPNQQANTAALEDLQRRVDAIAQVQAGSSVADTSLNGNAQAQAQALEFNIQQLQMVTAKNQKSLQTLALALESAESRNDGHVLLIVLGALLATCLSALAFAYVRLRRAGSDAMPWWSANSERAEKARPDDRPDALAAAQVQHDRSTQPSPLAGAELPATRQPALNSYTTEAAALHGTDLGKGNTVSMGPLLTTASAPVTALRQVPHRVDGAPTSPGSLKAINTREMLDVRQQAEFFMALGQHDEAVRLLESNITGSEDANPLVFLDLLKIFHTLSRRAEFEHYREEFNHQFTGRVPAYSSFLDEGNGLEAYDDICQQIVVLWPTEYTIDFIEQCLVRVPEDDPEQGIDLQAYKDLLLLYGVLKRLDQTADSIVMPFSTSRLPSNAATELQDAVAGEMPDINIETVPPLPVIAVQPPAPTLDLDLDLSAEGEAATPSEKANLIDFDMSGYEKPQAVKPPSQ